MFKLSDLPTRYPGDIFNEKIRELDEAYSGFLTALLEAGDSHGLVSHTLKIMKIDPVAEVVDKLGNPAQAVQWVEEQEPALRHHYANEIFIFLLSQAVQPKSVSGNSCIIRLCGFVDQASKAKLEDVRAWALSQDVLEKLFNFYIDWNESDHHRAMKLILDLVTQILRRQQDGEALLSAKKTLLNTLVPIVAGQSTKPVVKSAIKALDHLMAKKVITLEDLKLNYVSHRQDARGQSDIQVWRLLFADIFHWMRSLLTCPTAGRLMACIYRLLRQREENQSDGLDLETWHQWLLDFLAEDPSVLEGLKNFVFLTVFKADRAEALRFLRRMNDYQLFACSDDVVVDTPALLQLAALESGKKVGLVEDPALGSEEDAKEQNTSIVIHEKVFENVLSHPSSEVRTLAFSLLITSPATTKPYSSTALELLQKHLPSIFADADPKFRVEASGKVRDMFKRVRGAICTLKRSIPRVRAKARKANQDQANGTTNAASQGVVYRINLITLPENQLLYCLEYHEKFLRWYIRFLCGELAPGASYQRHVASVKALAFILRLEADPSKAWETTEDQEIFYDLFDSKWMRALFDLIMDPFEDVRELSAAAIKGLLSDGRYRMLTKDSQGGDSSPVAGLTELLRRANELARRTARADHSDGVARACQLTYRFSQEGEKRLSFLRNLVEELDRKISMAETDLGRAILDAPVHSDFASICFTWQVASEVDFPESELKEVESLQTKLVRSCERVWSAVRHVLCDDSPEGHLPQELEELDSLDTKDVLSYSFRAIHESSNLMRAIALTVRNRSRKSSITPPRDVFQRIGNLTFDQLSNLRHRGAFSTVSLTFATCCQQSKPLEQGMDRTLLDIWYDGTMKAIQAQASTTRRSAGIPSLMTGILSANAARPSFGHVVEELTGIAKIEARVTETDGSNLPQVHAFNCLKDIFKSSLLTTMGNESETYIPSCLELAASALRSEVWAIRNCGLIFLRSLIDCLFGSEESKAMIDAGWDGKANRIQYHRYPNLPKVLISLLKTGHEMITETPSTSSAAESVFPALDIIRRAGPPEILRDELQVHIAKYLASPVWHVREIAARTLCSCLLHAKWLAAIRAIFQDALSDSSRNIQNHVHGVLLTLKFVFERLGDVAPERLLGDLPELIRFFSMCGINKEFSNCPDIVAAYLEVVNMIWAFQRSHSQDLEPFDVAVPATSGTALFKTQKIVNNVFTVSIGNDPVEQLRSLLLGSQVGVNSLVTALETIPTIWHSSSTSDSTLSELCSLYIDICLKTGLVEAQAVAIRNLAEVLDRLLIDGRFDQIPSSALRALFVSLPLRSMSPYLSNALIRASGGIMASLRHFREVSTVGLQNWGIMIADAGHEAQSFDSRFAAAESLCSFFTVVEAQTCTSAEYLPIFLALYDALNDDDDEVRTVASAAARGVYSRALEPLEAATALIAWLGRNFADVPIFRPVVVRRIAGLDTKESLWTPSKDAFAEALHFDDSLFAVEKNNLFISEVRETQRWLSVFAALEWDAQDESLVQLNAWVSGGLHEIQNLIDDEDGPLGWASRPQVFSLCSRIIHASVALAKGPGSEGVREAVNEIKAKLASGDRHVSGLLVQPFEEGI